ncbi:MAG: hypothetical protein HY335_05025 [Deinococcus sp.]|nr:hypothetical protein [Deinococcus sp.]
MKLPLGQTSTTFRLAVLMASLLAFLGPQQAEAQGIAVSPPNFEATLALGESATGEFTLFNRAPDQAQVNVEVVDWTMNQGGEIAFLPPGSQPRSAARFIILSQTQFNLDPEAETVLRFTVSLPNDASLQGGYTALVVFTTVPVASTEQIGLSFSAQIAAGVNLVVNGTAQPQGQPTRLETLVSPEGTRQVVVTFQNTGNVLLRVTGTLSLRDLFGEPVMDLPIAGGAVLPDSLRDFKVDLPPEIMPGQYLALALFDFGSEQLLAGQGVIQVP